MNNEVEIIIRSYEVKRRKVSNLTAFRLGLKYWIKQLFTKNEINPYTLRGIIAVHKSGKLPIQWKKASEQVRCFLREMKNDKTE